VRQQHETMPYQAAMTGFPLPLLRLTQTSRSLTQEYQKDVSLGDRVKKIWQQVKRFRKFHPDPATRLQAVKTPEQVFGGWKETVVLAGTLTILLEVLMLTPLTLLHVSKWPMHFPTLGILVIVSLNYLLPEIAQGKPVRNALLKIIGIVTLLRLCMILGALSLLGGLQKFSPDLLLEMLPGSFAAASQAFRHTETAMAIDVNSFLAQAALSNVSQVIAVSLVLMIALALLTSLFRRLFTWYSYPHAERYLMRAAYWMLAIVSAFTGLTVLPFLSALILEPANLLNPGYTQLEVSGFIILILGLGCVRCAERAYARHCPQCGEKTSGTYYIGKRCCQQSCDTLLHPWLLAEYDV